MYCLAVAKLLEWNVARDDDLLSCSVRHAQLRTCAASMGHGAHGAEATVNVGAGVEEGSAPVGIGLRERTEPEELSLAETRVRGRERQGRISTASCNRFRSVKGIQHLCAQRRLRVQMARRRVRDVSELVRDVSARTRSRQSGAGNWE